ncbi:MAG: hypothetical protein LBQ42_00575 [Synergistaceae bacterium]|jgi:predicted amidophosphoribosyltransferase|nr:hypothetical protein [Synergistaceae bacterium]
MSLIETLVEVGAHMLWPVSCPVCGAVGKLLCEPCLRSLFGRPPLPRCLLCGEVIPCKVHGDNLSRIRAGSVYEGDMRELILMLKGKYESLAPRLGRGLAGIFPRPGLDVLVPVPLHLKSKRRYNQAEAIAKGLGDVWGVEVRNVARWTADVATRAGMNAAERLSLSQDVFDFGEDVAGLRLGLVDDVCTTGSTLSRLAGAARARGAEVVDAFVLASAAGRR